MSNNSGKQPAPNGYSNGEGSGSQNGGGGSSNPKMQALLAAAPRLTLDDQSPIEPPSYDDANSIQSGHITVSSMNKPADVGTTIAESLEFEYSFDTANTHDQLVTTVVRHPNAKVTILSITRLALGVRRPSPGVPLTFKLSGTPLSANQLEVQAKSNPEQGIKSIKVGMLDIDEDDPDLQFGVVDWMDRGGTGDWRASLPDVLFDRAYSMPPDILMFLTAFAIRNNSPRRIKATTSGSGQYGFHPALTAGATQAAVLDAKAFWLAVPKDTQRFDCGTFEVSGKGMVTISNTFNGVVTFTKYKFPKKKPPKVFVGLAGIDQDAGRPFRFSVAVTGKSHEGFSWTVRNWDESYMNQSWGATISWIAIADQS
ncbi:hypothetical protein ABW19_dt0201105 [Dactylella cylindrospora]|nr:hypothetical protein ABW19_dt0201105 [Dactylella cylindrospora]